MIPVKSYQVGSIDWLNNAIIISLFTDQRVSADEPLLEGQNQRGHWGDIFMPANESLGSKLWLLKRRSFNKQNDLLKRAKTYADEALKWLIDDSYVKEIDVITERLGNDMLTIQITCVLPSDYELKRSYTYAIA